MKTKNNLVILLTVLFINIGNPVKKESDRKPEEAWCDTDGNLININGGGILHHKGTYYWFGEIMSGKTFVNIIKS